MSEKSGYLRIPKKLQTALEEAVLKQGKSMRQVGIQLVETYLGHPQNVPDGMPAGTHTGTLLRVEESPQNGTNAIEAEPRPAGAHTESQVCPTCRLNEYKLELAGKELDCEKAARSAAETEAKAARSKVQVLESMEAEPPALPGVRDFLGHCDSANCEHSQEWQAVKQELVQHTIDNLPDDLIRAKAEERGFIPKSITIKNVDRIWAGFHGR